jgi:CheY-like chemotaxis protein
VAKALLNSRKVNAHNISLHLKELSNLRTLVDITNDNRNIYSGLNVFYIVNNSAEQLFIISNTESLPQEGYLKVSYGMKQHAFTFLTEINGPLEAMDDKFVLPIRIPKAIDKTERRESFRVVPFDEKPVRVKLIFPNKEFIYTDALDISEGGVSFPLPQGIAPLKVEDKYSLEIAIPGAPKISTTGTIIDLHQFLNITQLGVQFNYVSDADQRSIVQYRYLREAEIRNNRNNPENSLSRAKLIVIRDKEKADKYEFLMGYYLTQQMSAFNAITALVEGHPELIIIDCEEFEKELLLQAIRRNPELHNIPCIVKPTESTGCRKDDPLLFYSEFIDTPTLILPLIANILQMVELSKNIWRHWEKLAGLDRHILALDGSMTISDRCSEYLKLHNYRVHIFINEEKLLREINDQVPDILLIDDKIGDFDTSVFLSRLGMNKSIHRVPIILFTKDRAKAKSYRRSKLISAYIEKPINQRHLIQELTNSLVSKMILNSHANSPNQL